MNRKNLIENKCRYKLSKEISYLRRYSARLGKALKLEYYKDSVIVKCVQDCIKYTIMKKIKCIG